MKDKRRFSLVLTAILTAVSILPCYAATTREKIDDAEARKKTTESTLESTRNKIADLESKKDQSEAYLSDLSQQLTDLQESMEQLQRDSEAKQMELIQVQQELEEARQQEKQRYEDMKLRIQYMYENSSTGYMEVLFSSDNFGDFLNSAQNMAEITRYDREMLDEYAKVKMQVEEKETQVLEEQQQIALLQAQSSEKQEQIQELYEATYYQIREYSENIDSAQSEANKLLSEISAQEETITQLLIQAKNEEVERQRQEEERKRQERERQEQEAAQKAAKNKTIQNTSGSSQSSGKNQNSSNSTPATPTKAESGLGEQPSSDSQGTYLGKFKLTSYCACSSCCGTWSGGTTASGTTPTAGRTIAMAGLPFGTQLLINGHVYTVEDRGTQYGHVDVFCGSHSEAIAFGVRYADVYRLN